MLIVAVVRRLEKSAQQKHQRIMVSILSGYRSGSDGSDAARVLDVGPGNCWLLGTMW
jgi:hypothetical protein